MQGSFFATCANAVARTDSRRSRRLREDRRQSLLSADLSNYFCLARALMSYSAFCICAPEIPEENSLILQRADWSRSVSRPQVSATPHPCLGNLSIRPPPLPALSHRREAIRSMARLWLTATGVS